MSKNRADKRELRRGEAVARSGAKCAKGSKPNGIGPLIQVREGMTAKALAWVFAKNLRREQALSVLDAGELKRAKTRT